MSSIKINPNQAQLLLIKKETTLQVGSKAKMLKLRTKKNQGEAIQLWGDSFKFQCLTPSFCLSKK